MPTVPSKARFLGGLGMTMWRGDIPTFTVIPSEARNLAVFSFRIDIPFYRFMPTVTSKARFLGGLGMTVRGEYVLFEMQTQGDTG